MNRPGQLGRIITVLIYIFLIALAILCILPLIHVLAISLSGAPAAGAGKVTFWPVDFTMQSYKYVVGKVQFLTAIWISVKRVVLGVSIGMVLTILAAYPLSKEKTNFRLRTLYAWLFVFTILLNGGLIPWYITIRNVGLLDSIWALVIPTAVPVFNVVLLLNFFRNLPREIEEAAFVDGASHWTILFKIFIPLSMPALATLTLFSIVGHWNAWFDGLILMNDPKHYPLTSYLQTVVIGRELSQLTAQEAMSLTEISDKTNKSAQIFAASLPILMVYPFLQKHFIKGIVLGSVEYELVVGAALDDASRGRASHSLRRLAPSIRRRLSRPICSGAGRSTVVLVSPIDLGQEARPHRAGRRLGIGFGDTGTLQRRASTTRSLRTSAGHVERRPARRRCRGSRTRCRPASRRGPSSG